MGAAFRETAANAGATLEMDAAPIEKQENVAAWVGKPRPTRSTPF